MNVILNKDKGNRKCDWCGTRNIHIHRRYKGEGYCINCYKTWFVKKPCSKCGEIHRLHKKEDFAICTTCTRNNLCIRCGDDTHTDGVNTIYGRACQICYKGYFKEKKQCFECGEFKRNISRYSKLMHDQAVCVSCYQKSTREVCPSCRRFRKLVNSSNGRMCRKCSDYGHVPCPICDKQMPAGLGKCCEDCYWQEKLNKGVEVNTFLFYSNSIKNSYKDFIEWVKNEQSSRVAFLKHRDFIDFFVTCDEMWGCIESYERLVQQFKPAGLRQNLTVLKWLIDSKQVVVDKDLKLEVAEQSYIENALAKFEKVPNCIEGYYKYLLNRQQTKKTSIRSVRLALRPAIDVCIFNDIKDENTPSQEHIDTYLADKPGQFNSLYGYVVWLNKMYDLGIVINKPKKKASDNKLNKKQCQQLLAEIMYKQTKNKADEVLWYQTCLLYFHGIRVAKEVISNNSFGEPQDELVTFEKDGMVYWLPDFINL